MNCGVYLFRMEIFKRIAAVAAAKPKQRDIYDTFADVEYVLFGLVKNETNFWWGT